MNTAKLAPTPRKISIGSRAPLLVLGVFGFAEPALVNQAPARSMPGLGPSGFDPHAFGRAGLRAPLANTRWIQVGF